MNKTILTIITAALLAGAGAFYGGMKYAENKSPRGLARGDFQNLRDRTSGQGFVSGEILSKDDKSVTVKLQDARLPDGQGGSKIIFLSDSTKITKSTEGALSDLEVGKNISVNGAANSDGSITAQMIQLRPQP